MKSFTKSRASVMRRVFYISTSSGSLTEDDIRAIGRVSSRNNRGVDVTGVLLFAHEYFFQILEGGRKDVDVLLDRIKRDPRHRDLLILKVEDGVRERLFPKWSMRTIQLEGVSSMMLQAVRMMLENIAQSHRIIERYTQPAILELLTAGVNPLEIPARKVDRIVLFGDMVGFSCLAERFRAEEITDVVSHYLHLCSTHIRACGGEVSKYIGDCVMAHFPSDRADAAIEACVHVVRDLRKLRGKRSGSRLQRFVYGGFGLTCGEVIEGNVGSTIKMDYTILGEAVNLAQRIESLTRTIRRAVAFSEPLRQRAGGDWPFECMGEFQLKGSSAPCSVYSLSDPDVADFKDFNELLKLVEGSESASPDGSPA